MGRRRGQKAHNRARIGHWKRRTGRLSRWAVLVAALVAAIAGLRQSEVFYPVDVPFERDLYRHWTDDDGDCRNTRQEVLISESLDPPKLSPDGCRVVSGRWYDPFTGATFTNPSALDVDHRVPLSEAHRSGAHRWNAARRAAYANDLSHPDSLIAVDRSANRSKGDGDPLSWMPPDYGYWCPYAARWRATKQRWELQEDLLEGWWIDGVLAVCRGLGRPLGP
ncbi:MAG: HNH endonuclease [Alphaproteobacteria bacterium]|nr:HNH endonuclease [Alphaproteobacteria bacterium]